MASDAEVDQSILRRYALEKEIGKGSHGVVYKAKSGQKRKPASATTASGPSSKSRKPLGDLSAGRYNNDTLNVDDDDDDDDDDDIDGGKPRSLAERDALEEVGVLPMEPTLAESSAGRKVFADAKENDFFQPYFDQEGIALSETEFIDTASRFTPSFISFAVTPDRPPASCIPPSQFTTFLHKDSKQPGSYLSASYVPYNQLVAFRDGMIKFPAGVDQKYHNDLEVVVAETLKIVDAYYPNPSATDPLVAIIYAGLTSFNTVFNPDAEGDVDGRKGRMQQHMAGGFSKSLHSAGIAFFLDSGLFEGSQHHYGLTAVCAYADVVAAAGCEVFESAVLVGGGRGWSSNYGETLNKACVGLVSKRDDQEEQLWQRVWKLRVLVGDDVLLTSDAVGSELAHIARYTVLKQYIIQTHNLSDGVDTAAISLWQFSSAITAHAAAVRWGIGTDDARAAALVAFIPREELLGAIKYRTAHRLNMLIIKKSVDGCHTFGIGLNGAYERIRKLVLKDLDEEDTRAERQSDESRAAALVAFIPREELLGAIKYRTARRLNNLIVEKSVDGCHTFSSRKGGAYERVRKLVLKDLDEEDTAPSSIAVPIPRKREDSPASANRVTFATSAFVQKPPGSTLDSLLLSVPNLYPNLTISEVNATTSVPTNCIVTKPMFERYDAQLKGAPAPPTPPRPKLPDPYHPLAYLRPPPHHLGSIAGIGDL